MIIDILNDINDNHHDILDRNIYSRKSLPESTHYSVLQYVQENSILKHHKN